MFVCVVRLVEGVTKTNLDLVAWWESTFVACISPDRFVSLVFMWRRSGSVGGGTALRILRAYCRSRYAMQ